MKYYKYCWLPCLAIGLLACTASQPFPKSSQRVRPPIVSTTAQAVVEPTVEQFMAHLSYPYRAPRPRRLKIERAAKELRVGATEEEVLAMLGQPDFRAPYMRGRKHRLQAYAEVWCYVHTWVRQTPWVRQTTPPEPPSYWNHGKGLGIELTNESKPRVVVRVTKYGFD